MMGSRIREARKLARLTQEQLAEKAELNRVTVAVLESGKNAPSADTLWRIALATGQSMDWFFQEGTPAAPARVQEPAPAAPPAPLDRTSAEEAPPPPPPPVTPDLAVLIAQAVGQAVGQAVASLHTKLDAQASVLQSQASRLSSQAHELARLHKEVREHLVSGNFCGNHNGSPETQKEPPSRPGRGALLRQDEDGAPGGWSRPDHAVHLRRQSDQVPPVVSRQTSHRGRHSEQRGTLPRSVWARVTPSTVVRSSRVSSS